MKKIISLSFCVLTFIIVHAQDTDFDFDEGQSSEYKQNSGDKNFELQFDPGAIFNATNGNNIFSNGVGIRFRLFPSSTLAFRVNLNISYTSSSTITQEADDAANIPELKDKFSSMEISLRPGIEKHFGGTERLSPYVGAEAIFGFQTSTDISEYELVPDVYAFKTKNGSFGDGLTIGVAGVAGVDFYIAKKLYLGLELNYGIYYSMAATTKTSSDEPNFTGTESKLGNTNTLTFRPGAMGMFRIGYLF